MSDRELLNRSELSLLLGLEGDGSMSASVEWLTRAQTELRLALDLINVQLNTVRIDALDDRKESSDGLVPDQPGR